MKKLTPEQQKMVLDNYNLPHFVMHKYFPHYQIGSYEYEDLSQEGYLGLCIAVMRYDDTISAFSTYAINVIWGYILKYINTKSGWAFHRRIDSKWTHIPYGSLNMITCEGNSEESDKELIDIVSDNRGNNYSVSEIRMDLLPSFMKASPKYGVRVLELIELGYGQRAIADILKTSQPTVSRILSKADYLYHMYCNYDPRNPDRMICEMLDKGLRSKIISDALNIDINYIKRVKKERDKKHEYKKY